MSTHLHSFLLALVVGFAYFWIKSPVLAPFALQAFALSAVLYFLLKRLAKAKLWHLAPAQFSGEMVVATFAFLILIGSTGNTHSIFYPFIYVQLFFLVLSTRLSTSLITIGLVTLFHYALSPVQTTQEITAIATIPLMSVFFLFAKYQYEEVIRERSIIETDERALAATKDEEGQLLDFISALTIKVSNLKQLSRYAAANQKTLMGQLTLLEIEIEKVVARFRK